MNLWRLRSTVLIVFSEASLPFFLRKNESWRDYVSICNACLLLEDVAKKVIQFIPRRVLLNALCHVVRGYAQLNVKKNVWTTPLFVRSSRCGESSHNSGAKVFPSKSKNFRARTYFKLWCYQGTISLFFRYMPAAQMALNLYICHIILWYVPVTFMNADNLKISTEGFTQG